MSYFEPLKFTVCGQISKFHKVAKPMRTNEAPIDLKAAITARMLRPSEEYAVARR